MGLIMLAATCRGLGRCDRAANTTSAAAYEAGVKSRIANLLMCLF